MGFCMTNWRSKDGRKKFTQLDLLYPSLAGLVKQQSSCGLHEHTKNGSIKRDRILVIQHTYRYFVCLGAFDTLTGNRPVANLAVYLTRFQ